MENTNLGRVAIYTRCSTDEQTTEMQVTAIQRFLSSREHNAEIVYEDMGISGATSNRPAFQKMIADARRNRFDTVIVYRLDRFSRSMKDILIHLQLLGECQVAFISVNDNLDLSTSIGRLSFHLISAFAEFEREVIAERVKSGLAAAKKRGAKFGRPMVKVDLEKLKQLKAQGYSYGQMSKITGHSSTLIWRRLEKLNSPETSL
jgi:DNA invertase Pin-like site-specific DNA recombinase